MKKRFSEEQIIRILEEGSVGSVTETCRKHGIGAASYYNWKRKYEGMTVPDAQKLRSLEDENRKLKKLLAESLLDNDALKSLVQKYGNAR